MSDEEMGLIINRTKISVRTKRKRLKLKRPKIEKLKKVKQNKFEIIYSEENAKSQLIKIFNEIKKPPNKEDAKKYNMKPSREWYVDKYGSIINACVYFGLMEKPLTIEERMEISIIELKNIAKELNRIPSCDEYTKMKDKGYSEYPLKKHFNMNYSQICEKYLSDYKENIPEGYKKCCICNEVKEIYEFGTWKNDKTELRGSCKLCEYIKRNGINIPSEWTKKECKILIDNLLNEKVKYLNELCLIINKELHDIIKYITKYNILDTKPRNIKVFCSYCKKEETKCLSVYLKNKEYFCSLDCYWNYKKECEPKGENHPQYNRIDTKCDNCEVDIGVIPYQINNNKHNFCSQECYWEFRSKYYIGENHPQFGIEKTPEQREKMRIATVKRFENGSFKRLTKPQMAVNSILEELNIKYNNEYNCKYYSIDNYLSDYNLMIEVNGDYFHSNPLLFSKLNQMQLKGIVRDKRKRTYIKKYHSIDILYLWENDLKNNQKLCKELILKYINNKGNLDNYNSYNYSIIDSDFKLNENIIIPYIDWDIKDLNKITYVKEQIIS